MQLGVLKGSLHKTRHRRRAGVTFNKLVGTTHVLEFYQSVVAKYPGEGAARARPNFIANIFCLSRRPRLPGVYVVVSV